MDYLKLVEQVPAQSEQDTKAKSLAPDEIYRLLEIPLPCGEVVTLTFPATMDLDDWVMVADMLAAFSGRWIQEAL